MRNPKRYQVFVPGDPKVAGDRDLMADAMGLREVGVPRSRHVGDDPRHRLRRPQVDRVRPRVPRALRVLVPGVKP